VVAHDTGKIVVLLVTILSATVLLALQVIPDAAGVGIITAALGYVTGNGLMALRGERPSPALTSRVDHESPANVRVYPEAAGEPERGWPE
jgi:hypothetical protein